MLRHVPFGADWDMPVEVSVSEWVVAAGTGWSCGQCPLDARGAVVAPDEVEAQARLVGDRIAAGMARAGLAPERILALVVYGIDPVLSAALLASGLPWDVPVLPVAVPALYYPGMTLEVDVIAAEASLTRQVAGSCAIASAPGLSALTWRGSRGEAVPTPAALAEAAGRAGDEPLSTLLALPRGMAVPGGWPSASVRWVPRNAPSAGLLLFGDGAATVGRMAGDTTIVEVAEAGPLLRLSAWCPDAERPLGAQAEAAMSALVATLAARGSGPEALVKVTAHHVGEGAAALHESLAARHRHHVPPGPASTGLGVAGLGVEGAAVLIEAIAAP